MRQFCGNTGVRVNLPGRQHDGGGAVVRPRAAPRRPPSRHGGCQSALIYTPARGKSGFMSEWFSSRMSEWNVFIEDFYGRAQALPGVSSHLADPESRI